MLTSIATRGRSIWCERTYPGRPKNPEPFKPIAIPKFEVRVPEGYKEGCLIDIEMSNERVMELAKLHNLFLLKEKEDPIRRTVVYRTYYRNKWNFKSFLRDWFRPKK